MSSSTIVSKPSYQNLTELPATISKHQQGNKAENTHTLCLCVCVFVYVCVPPVIHQERQDHVNNSTPKINFSDLSSQSKTQESLGGNATTESQAF